jgi:SAM-dependent methyltransferase
MQRPKYDKGDKSMLATRAPLAKNFAKLILDTTLPFLKRSPQELTVIDIGCGYGHTAIELAKQCRYVVGIEPMPDLYQFALQLKASSGLTNIEFRQQSVYDLTEVEAYDLVVLDNVFEHLPDQRLALEKICQVLKPKGAVYILTPNKIWPIEPHYHLPFLSYLPLSLANFYLRITGRGEDYSDACYLPTYFRDSLAIRPAFGCHFGDKGAFSALSFRCGTNPQVSFSVGNFKVVSCSGRQGRISTKISAHQEMRPPGVLGSPGGSPSQT